jgi:hypothetical protein
VRSIAEGGHEPDSLNALPDVGKIRQDVFQGLEPGRVGAQIFFQGLESNCVAAQNVFHCLENSRVHENRVSNHWKKGCTGPAGLLPSAAQMVNADGLETQIPDG